MTFPTPGPYVLNSGAGLPNVTVAFPGEHFSNCKASGIINPGDVVVPFSSGGERYVRRAASSADALTQCSIALNPVQPPDINIGSLYAPQFGPNEIVNRPLTHGSYVHQYYSGYFHLTVATPDASYAPGDLIGWDPAAALPTGKPFGVPAAANAGQAFPASTTTLLAGQPDTGAWKKGAPVGPLAEVIEFRPYSGGVAGEGILSIRILRANP